MKASSENPILCVTPFAEMLIYLCVNSAFGSVANLDFGVFGGRLKYLGLIRKRGSYFEQ